MAKKAKANISKQPKLQKVCKKFGRSSGKLVDGLFGNKVTPKVLAAQKANHELRNNRS